MSNVLKPALVIAVDGPSGSGKSSTSRKVAEELGCDYLDTGSMYRALALWCVERQITADDGPAVTTQAADFPIEIDTNPGAFRVRLDGRDVTDQLHTPEVSGMVSGFAAIRSARNELSDRMRRIIAERGRIVVEGRDITTVVAPDAHVRVLLQADPARRIDRRLKQLEGAADTATVTDQVVGRDAKDSTSSNFDTPAPGVTLIDSTDLSFDEVVEQVVALVPHPLRKPLKE